jgi:hypothetical protein
MTVKRSPIKVEVFAERKEGLPVAKQELDCCNIAVIGTPLDERNTPNIF